MPAHSKVNGDPEATYHRVRLAALDSLEEYWKRYRPYCNVRRESATKLVVKTFVGKTQIFIAKPPKKKLGRPKKERT